MRRQLIVPGACCIGPRAAEACHRKLAPLDEDARLMMSGPSSAAISPIWNWSW
jgi:hypothetical protein